MTTLRTRMAFRFILPGSLAAVMCGLLYVALGMAAGKADAIALAKEKGLLEATVLKLAPAIERDQENLTIWDETVKNVEERNMQWLHEYVGLWMHEQLRFDVSVVVDADGSEIYRFPHTEPDHASDTYMPLLQELQQASAGALLGRVSSASSRVGVSDMVRIGDRGAIVSVKPILPHSGTMSLQGYKMPFHVAIRYLNGLLASELAQEYDLKGLRFVLDRTGSAPSAIPFRSSDGALIGFFEWEQFQPGEAIVGALSPVLFLAFFVLFGCASFVGELLWQRTESLTNSLDRLQHQATHDALTGLFNRVQFNVELEQRVRNPQKVDSTSVLFIDLDRFKQVNDSLGHAAGDELLKMVATRLRTVLPDALIARMGGDEFTAILDNVDLKNTELACREIVEVVSRPFSVLGAQAQIGASIGFAQLSGASDPEEVTRRADMALYQAKAAGRNTWVRFTGELAA